MTQDWEKNNKQLIYWLKLKSKRNILKVKIFNFI